MSRRGGSGGLIAFVIAALIFAAIGQSGGVVSTASAVTTGGATTASANEQLGMQMATAAGYDATQRRCLNMLWTRESGWIIQWNHQNSGAYGIPQALPASKMASAGADYMTNAATQIRWGLGYIASRYGPACAAWDHEQTQGWY